MRNIAQIFLLISLIGATTGRSDAQAIPTATRAGIAQLGLGYTIATPDYGHRKIQGGTIYGTFDFTRHWGIEGDVHRASLITPEDIGEDSYLVGPRYVFHHNRFMPYAKALGGIGRFKYQYDFTPHTTYTYKMYALGGGLDYRASYHINVRAIDFEYQKWPGYPTSGLTPLVFTFGAAYTF